MSEHLRLTDITPPNGGEYFYTIPYPFKNNIHKPMLSLACFVCGIKTVTLNEVCKHLEAIAQCPASALRIISMFKKGSCYEMYPESYGAMSVFVSSCEKHERHLKFLHSLVASDGIITKDRVTLAERAPICRDDFYKLVSKEAHDIFCRKQPHRSHDNWCDAWPLCIEEFGRIPSPTEHKSRAERLWQERKESKAEDDWLSAEKNILSLYSVE